jgi:hypothetical protein
MGDPAFLMPRAVVLDFAHSFQVSRETLLATHFGAGM